LAAGAQAMSARRLGEGRDAESAIPLNGGLMCRSTPWALCCKTLCSAPGKSKGHGSVARHAVAVVPACGVHHRAGLGYGLLAIWAAQVAYRIFSSLLFVRMWRRGDWATIDI